MPALSVQALLDALQRLQLLEPQQWQELTRADRPRYASVDDLVQDLLGRGWVTRYQGSALLQGRGHELVLGSYLLLERLGEGGMGVVFKARQRPFGRMVALKTIRKECLAQGTALRRFEREIRAAAQLRHPNIIFLYDADTAGETRFLVMELVEGTDLQNVVRSRGPLPALEATDYVRQAALGLQHAHERGLVHRDVKPANLLLVRGSSVVKVLDLGLARLRRSRDGGLQTSAQLTQTGAVAGTVDYMAPEQALEPRTVDIRADVYSLGCTFYHLLAGHPPFPGGTWIQKLLWHQSAQPVSIKELRPDLAPELSVVLRRMMAKHPHDRYPTPGDVAVALEAQLTAPTLPVGQPGVSRTAAAPPVATIIPAGPLPRSAAQEHVRGVESSPTRLQSVTTIPGPPSAPSSPQPKLPPQSPASADRWWRTWLLAVSGATVLAAGLLVGTLGWLRSRGDGHHRPTQAEPSTSGAPERIEAGTPTKPARRGTGHPLSNGQGPSVKPANGIAGQVSEPVPIREENGTYHVEGVHYEADVAPDGCVPSLRAGGVEFLRPDVDISRGAYLLQPPVGLLRLDNVRKVAPDVIEARNDLASIRYQFGSRLLTWTPKNLTDKPMRFFLVFSKAVTAVANDRGELIGLPTSPPDTLLPTKKATWYAGRSKLTVHGADSSWGWVDDSEVCEVLLAPHAARQLVLEVGDATEAERSRVAEATGTKELTATHVSVRTVQKNRLVQTPTYEAKVEADGCLTQLRIGGLEWLLCGQGTESRGVYAYDPAAARGQEDPVCRLREARQPEPSVIEAHGDKAQIRYEFGDNGMRWTITNRMRKGDMPLYMVFSPVVTAVRNDRGEVAKTPTAQPSRTTTWFAGKTKLTIHGGTKVWGPWEGRYQVWQLSVAPGQTRRVLLEWGKVSAAEDAKVNPLIDLASPTDYQVFQRHSGRGRVTLRGRVQPQCDRVEVRLTGKSLKGKLPDRWHSFAVKGTGHEFEGSLTVPAGGWYAAEVRARNGAKVVAQTRVDRVGVGEVFITAGQSNSANYGEVLQTPKDDRVAAWNGHGWQPAKDPQPNVAGTGGTPWPVLGDLLVQKLNVPVGFVSVGVGGTPVEQWQPGSPLYARLKEALRHLGQDGARCVLWHQGESDTGNHTSATDYARRLNTIIRQSREDAGYDLTWLVAGASYVPPPSDPAQAEAILKDQEEVRHGQEMVVNGKDTLAGPTTDGLVGDYRHSGDRIHFSDKGLKEHARRWFDVLMKTVYKAERPGRGPRTPSARGGP